MLMSKIKIFISFILIIFELSFRNMIDTIKFSPHIVLPMLYKILRTLMDQSNMSGERLRANATAEWAVCIIQCRRTRNNCLGAYIAANTL